MPDHLHLFVEGRVEDSSLVEFVHRAKQMSGYHGRHVAGSHIWQAGYHDRVVRDDEDPRRFIAYIINNPIRAGLAKSVRDYPFAGSGVYSQEQLLEYIGTMTP